MVYIWIIQKGSIENIKLIMRIRKEGIIPIFISVFLGIIIALFSLWVLAIPFFVFGAFLLNFFRDPERIPESKNESDLISPADGKVFLKDEVIIPGDFEFQELRGKKMRRIAIFMSPLDVHVNRSPVSGEVVNIVRKSGGFERAFLEKSELNSRVLWHIRNGKDNFILVQIAGAIARRIKTFKKVGDRVARAERIGMIYLGSRVDLYIPENYKFSVEIGQKVLAGKTKIASKTE